MNRFRYLSRVLAAGLCQISILYAQQTINHASLGGQVTDPEGRVVHNATVATKQLTTNITRNAVTDSEGRFRFPYLAVGSYQITVNQTGFAPATRNVALTVGADFHLPISLALASAETSINVSGAPPVLESNRTQIAETISENEVHNLSQLGRSFLDLALLVPGVSP